MYSRGRWHNNHLLRRRNGADRKEGLCIRAEVQYEFRNKKQVVTVKTYVDGDTTHFHVPEDVVPGGVLKARYLAIDTPESTGKSKNTARRLPNSQGRGCHPPSASLSSRTVKNGTLTQQDQDILSGSGIRTARTAHTEILTLKFFRMVLPRLRPRETTVTEASAFRLWRRQERKTQCLFGRKGSRFLLWRRCRADAKRAEAQRIRLHKHKGCF